MSIVIKGVRREDVDVRLDVQNMRVVLMVSGLPLALIGKSTGEILDLVVESVPNESKSATEWVCDGIDNIRNICEDADTEVCPAACDNDKCFVKNVYDKLNRRFVQRKDTSF